MKRVAFALLLLIVACAPQAEQTPQEQTEPTQESGMVAYFGDVQGYYAVPADAEAPGIVLIHEWWGLNDNIKETADKLVSQGYRVLAVDLYHGQVATNSSGATALMQKVDQDESLANLNAAVSYLKSQGSTKVASWGYCFGGGQSATLAASSSLDAAVVYYGNLAYATSHTDQIQEPMLFIYGDQDTSTTAASAQNLTDILTSQGKEAEIHIYPGVGHAFANPSNPRHDEQKTQDAWEKTIAFLNRTLR